MKTKYNFIRNLVFLFFLLVVIFIIVNNFIEDKQKKLIDIIYTSKIHNINLKINTLIKDKQNATTALALTLSKDYKIIKSLYTKDYDILKYDDLSSLLKGVTDYKNVWIKIYNSDANLIYQSYKDISSPEHKTPIKSIKQVIEVNNYDLSFSTFVPIFDDERYLGYLKLSTKFNSISKALEKSNIMSAVLVNKEDSKKIKDPFSNKVYKGFYIANKNISENTLDLLEKIDLNSLNKDIKYKLIDEYIYSKYILQEGLAYILYFQNKKDINVDSIKSYKFSSYTILISSLLLVLLFFIIYVYNFNYKEINKLNKSLKYNIDEVVKQKDKVKSLLDSQSSIIVITDGEDLVDANKKLIEFYSDCSSLDEFKNKYKCVCTTFEDFGYEDYVLNKDYDGKNWAEYILANSNKSLKVAIYNQDKVLRHFSVKVVKQEIGNFLIVTLSDITDEMKTKKDLEEFNTKLEKLVDEKTKELKELNDGLEKRVEKEIELNHYKDKIIFEQNKMSSISELLNNIAHHWRQPLSVISSSASAIKLQKQLDLLDDSFFYKSCDLILGKSQYLSETIDSFSNLFNKNQDLKSVNLHSLVVDCLNHLKSILKENLVKIDIEIKEDIQITVYENDFKQVILHIINNSLKALSENCKNEEKIILIKYENNKLFIQDNAKGLDESLVNKIFEPYFTTYHKFEGKGLGLYMVKEILLKNMNYCIDARNEEFEYENNKYKGLRLEIYQNKEIII